MGGKSTNHLHLSITNAPKTKKAINLGKISLITSEELRKGGDIMLFITLNPKFYNKVFLFVGLTTLGTLGILIG